jgi:predicted dehydrogenase
MPYMDVTRRELLQTTAALSAAPLRAANDRIQVGIIGCGARSHQLMDALLSIQGVEITGVVDAYKGRVERSLDRVKGRAKPFRSHADILADKSFDAVVIATPDHLHKPMLLEAFAAGKDVYCEKPLTYKSTEGAEIVKASRGRILQVGSQGISSLPQQTVRDIIKSGKIGKVTMIRAAYNRNTASGAWIYPIPPDASPATVNWEMFLGSAPKRPFNLERFFRWRCYQDYSGGIATDLFVHLCNTIHYVMDAKVPSKVVGMGQLYRWKESRDVPDTLNGILEYPEGFAVNLSSTFNNQTQSETGFQFHGTEGTLVIGSGISIYPEQAREDNAWIVDSWPKALAEAYYRDPKVRAAELGEGKPARMVRTTEQYRQDGPGDSTRLHLAAWLDAIRTRKPVWEDATAGHHAAACAHMINQSAKTGRAVEWDFSKDDIRAGA